MDSKSQAQKLSVFINQYTLMWNDEIMNEYPDSLRHYPQEWLELLADLTPNELYAIDCKKIIPQVKDSSFAHFMQEAKELSALPLTPERPEIPLEDWAFNGVKEKKRHEIQKIVPKIKEMKDKTSFEYVVDIGGGVGHLSRVLSHYHSIPSVSLDRDLAFQKIGIERLSKYRKIDGAQDVQFINLTFGEADQENILKDIFKTNSFSLGLHTCGSLANTLIQKTLQFQTTGLLSFGCCYYRLNPTTDFPLSAFYINNSFPKLNLFALTLATRSHAPMSREDYNTKERVKYYRYALHLFLLKHFHNKYFTDVGECPIRVYWGPFSFYMREKLERLKIEHDFSDDDFNEFYADPKLQAELKKMYLANIIRWQLGRVLEVYLLLDRVCFLEEQSYQVKIEQYFNEELSPRNIGILAIKTLL
ncbi:MAG: methyltransferase [Bacteriovorax sp.]|nr:methyltransferase [Bacteriovorax sp.]